MGRPITNQFTTVYFKKMLQLLCQKKAETYIFTQYISLLITLFIYN